MNKTTLSIIPHFTHIVLITCPVLLILGIGLGLTACVVQAPQPSAYTPTAFVANIVPSPSSVQKEINVEQLTAQTTPSLPIALINPAGVSVNFWYSMPSEQILPLIDEFNKTNQWGIVVKGWMQSSNNDLSEYISQGLLQKDNPQVAMAFTDQAVRWDIRNEVVDLTPFIKDIQWGLKADESDDYFEYVWRYGVVNQKRLSVPALMTGKFFFYNQTWAKEMGFDQPPSTTEEFTKQVCAGNEYRKQDDKVENDYTGGWLANIEPGVMLGWFYAFGGDIINQSNVKEQYSFDTEANQSAFFFLKNLYDKNCIYVSTEAYGDEEFVQRRALVVSGGTVDLPYQKMAFLEANSQDEWTMLPFPSQTQQTYTPIQIPSFVLLPAKPEEQLASWLFVRWMLSPSSQAKWSSLSGYYPARISARDLMEVYAKANPQWKAGYDWLSKGKSEPVLPSWGSVRWALQDANIQLFRPYFTTERVPLTLQELDRTSMEMIEMRR